MKRMLVLFGAVLLASQGQAAERGELRIVGPDALAAVWTPLQLATPAYPQALAARGVTGCVTLSYVIGTDGRVSRVDLLDGTASPRAPLAERQAVESFADAAAVAMADWRFTPRDGAAPTLTAATLHFGDAADEAVTCPGTTTARLVGQGRPWDIVLQGAYKRTRRADLAVLASAPRTGGDMMRAMDSPWDGTSALILSDPYIAAGAR